MTCGMTPEKLVLTLCLGIALGTMPLLWGTSFIGIMLAYLFGLNQVALQTVNYLLYPVQLVWLIPFFKLGEWLFPWGPTIPKQMLSALLHGPGLTSLNILGWITVKSLAAWLVTAIPILLIAYGILMIAAGKNSPEDKGYEI